MKKSKKIVIISSITICFTIIVFSTIFALINSTNKNIISGIQIQKIDVSNKNREETEQDFKELLEKLNNKKIILKYEDYETNITLSELNINYNFYDAIEKAYNIGRKDNIIINNYRIIKTKIFGTNIELQVEYDEQVLDKKIERINSSLPGVYEDYSYYIENEKLVITQGKPGVTIETEVLKREIENVINNIKEEDGIIEIPVENKNPEKINITKIYNEIYKEPENAYITTNPTTVHPHVNGVDFGISIEEAENIIKEEKDEYIVPLKITVAEKTINDLGEEAFPDTLGTFVTRYDVTNKNRSNNLDLASDKINGTIILPGEVFSYNQIVGKRTIEAGYKEAGAYAGGQVIQEVGGGICQVSSTLYNAVLYANLEIIERNNHYFETSYVDPGRDATVSWGTVDFKFKNNRTYPIKVEATSSNGVNKISIKGIKEKTEYEVTIQSKVTSIIQKETEYITDKSLESSQEIVQQEGHNGCTSQTYKILKSSGTIISNELISSDYYHALKKIIKKGDITNKKENIEETNSIIDTLNNEME